MKKIKVLALVMVFAFAALGGAYAMWFDELYVDATAKTGIVDLQWADLHVVDPSPNYTGYPDDYVFGTDGNRDGLDTLDKNNKNDHKNIGCLDAEIMSIAQGTGGTGDQDINSSRDQILLTLTNGYPGYQEYIDVSIENLGTVPVKLSKPIFENKPEWLEVGFYKHNADDETGYSKINLEGYQLDPNKKLPIMIVCRVLEKYGDDQICPQNATARFTMTLKGVQWNEYKFKLKDKIQFPRNDNFPFPPYDNNDTDPNA